MNFLDWMIAAGILLLTMSMLTGWLNRTPVPMFGLYLVVGIACGQWGLGLVNIDVFRHTSMISRATEIAMAASLFITGLKLRFSFSAPVWKIGVVLALPTMLLTVGGMMLIAHYLAGFSWPIALAFGAIVAPTDPVLASLVAVNDARDSDWLRLSLSSEAGLNDGTALPLLMLALIFFHANEAPLSADQWIHWLSVDLLWGLFAGLTLGFGLGRGVGLLATRSRHLQQDVAPSDFIALALMALSFSLATYINASAFLAAFAAGVGLRSAEVSVQKRHKQDDENGEIPPAETMVNPHSRHRLEEQGPVKSVGLVIGDALSFGDTVERLLAATLVILLGMTLALHWDIDGLMLAVGLFVVVRPIAVLLMTWEMAYSWKQRMMMGWLGIRGIGSINYIAFALLHGLQGEEVTRMVNCAVTLITFSVLLHGVTVGPLQKWRRKKK
ncbi:cation:proton antiporter [Rahnella perminowiae]|jgi:sodium/hydrogen antiporter|uniref:cation:proton antiporter n=1 Tax=Rahnella TaxID=34037 RepID=UPI0010210798|nr:MULTISPECIES: cation:proton antiporter [Rahnella]MCR9003155.1 cation:proton antiporter [Rahnella perminowiae]MCX2945077.1 cation:proton antiporter [Rahnella perminowiae]